MPSIGRPHCAAASRPPCRDLQAAPHRRGASRRYAGPLPLGSGDGRPRFGHSPAADAAWRGLRRGLAFLAPPSSRHTSWSGSTAGLRVVLARIRSLASASAKGLGVHAGLCPPSAGKAARVRSGGGPPAFLPRRRTCRKVPRPETGRPRHARYFPLKSQSRPQLDILPRHSPLQDRQDAALPPPGGRRMDSVAAAVRHRRLLDQEAEVPGGEVSPPSRPR